MAGPGGAARTEKAKRGGFAGLVIGMVIGALGAIFLPDLASPYLPDSLRGERVQVEGVIEAKSTEGDRLLLTVGSEAGATLVTFRDDIARIDLLVSVGDSVQLEVDEYTPFIDDADIRRVMKPRDWRVAPPTAVDTTPDMTTTPDTSAADASADSIDADSIDADGAAVDTAVADETTRAPDAGLPGDVP